MTSEIPGKDTLPLQESRAEKKTDKLIHVLFGLGGSGKNFIAEILVKDFGFQVLDGDEEYTDEMKQVLATGSPVPDDMRDRYNLLLMNRIEELRQQCDRLAVVQWLPKERHRREISERFPEAVFVHVKASEQVLDQRILSRKGHFLTAAHILNVRKSFEEPHIPHKVIHNNSDEVNLVSQIEDLLSGSDVPKS